MHRLRVLHVTNYLTDAGGAEVSLIQLLPHLQANGIDNAVQPLWSFKPTSRRASLEQAGVVVRPGQDGDLSRRIRTVSSAVEEFRPDAIHSTVWDADLVGRLIGRFRRIPTISGIVNAQYSAEAYARSEHRRKLAAYQVADGLLARHATTAFHALTQHAADEAVRALKIRRRSIHVIPRGRDRAELGELTEQRRQAMRSSLGIANDEFVVVNVARQMPQKAVPDLIRAFREVETDLPTAVLVQAGREATDTPEVKRLIAEFGLSGRVRLLGRRSDVPDILASADVFVSSAHWEGQGGAVLEAMGMGLPVVAYGVPAVAESLGGLGVLVPIGEAEALGAEVVRLARDPEARIAIGKDLRNRFDSTYEISAVAERMTAMYTQVVEGGPLPVR